MTPPLTLPQVTYVSLSALAMLVTLLWMVRPFDNFNGEGRAVAPLTLVSTTVWAIIALRGGTLAVYSGGSSFTVDVPELQLTALAMALLSFAAFVLWFFGEFPPQDDEINETTDPGLTPGGGD